MEIFKTDVLRKEFEKFHKEILVDVLKCGLCQKTACKSFHHKFLVSCKFCWENYCKACKTFNSAKEVLFKSLDNTEKAYVQNFRLDFLNLSAESLENHYQISKPISIAKEKTFDVKSYHKSEKNRSQVVYKKFNNCDKLNYSVKGKNAHFIRNFNLILDNIEKLLR